VPKSFKSFVKEYSMGLQVPATSYLKPIASLSPLRRKENVKRVREKWIKELKKNLRKNFNCTKKTLVLLMCR
jgi:hypothetical protein